MKQMKWPLRAFIFVGLLQVIACTKTSDPVTFDSDNLATTSNISFPVANEFANCKLRRIYYEHPGTGSLVNALFTYNKAGNPISLTYYNNNGGDGNPTHLFFYDNQGRLKEWQVTYFPGLAPEWRHLYGYDANNRIVTDTLDGGPRMPETEVIFVSTLTYDNQGRIIKENIKNIKNYPDTSYHPVRNPTYTYDSRGNLAVAGWKSSSYDRKVSLFRSHPVFQFIFRNYSMNNPAPQVKYNSKGLPLMLTTSNDAFFNADPATDAFKNEGIYKITYDCQ